MEKWEINDLFVTIIFWILFTNNKKKPKDQRIHTFIYIYIYNNQRSSVLSCCCPPVDRECISSSNGSSGLIAR